MPPRAKTAIADAVRITGTTYDRLMTRETRRRTLREVLARRYVIAALYDPATAGKKWPHGQKWGVAEIGRLLGMNHTTIIYHVEQMGLKTKPFNEAVQ